MKSTINYLVAMFMFMYWGFRVVVTYMYQTGREFIATPINVTSEIIILFITLICILLVCKRKMLGGIVYVLAYLGYFGVHLYQLCMPIINGGSFSFNSSLDIFFSAVAVILSIVVLMDVSLSQIKPVENKQTSWFYDNKDFDIQHDSRDDRNNYRL